MLRLNLVRPLFAIIFNIFLPLKVEGYENVPKEGKALILPNHTGIMDMFFVGYKLPRMVHWMAKAELFKNKLFGGLLSFYGAYPVRRGGHDTSAARKTFELLDKGELVGIFPQGTRARKGKPIPKAKSGALKYAIETDTPVIPVAIWGKKRLFGKMHVKFGKPIMLPKPPEGERYSREEYLELAQNFMDDIYSMMK